MKKTAAPPIWIYLGLIAINSEALITMANVTIWNQRSFFGVCHVLDSKCGNFALGLALLVIFKIFHKAPYVTRVNNRLKPPQCLTSNMVINRYNHNKYSIYTGSGQVLGCINHVLGPKPSFRGQNTSHYYINHSILDLV